MRDSRDRCPRNRFNVRLTPFAVCKHGRRVDADQAWTLPLPGRALTRCSGWLRDVVDIREALSGTTRFMDFPPALPKLARTLLSEYLQRLIAIGVIEPCRSAKPACTTNMSLPSRDVIVSGRDGFEAVGCRLSVRSLRTAPVPGRSAYRNPGTVGSSYLCRRKAHHAPRHPSRLVRTGH